jgi:NADH-quinone oxidoreductase subunit G
MIEIKINNQTITTEDNSRLIDICDKNNIKIPRFCYHKNLSIAASCRMCLVEVKGNPKMQPACSTLVYDGMEIFTENEKVKKSQQAVMEFLLINHPLDCPICDQGGECELQDVAINYGSNQTFFSEGKRVVADDDIGELIQTDLTRCIHCTRCVRFGTEIAGISELGAIGRGDEMQISTFLASSVDSELSGNMIDICPVGALTSKPFRYAVRSWQMQNHLGVARHDALGSNLNIQTFNDKVYRISSRENPAVNGSWISDIDRFSYLSLQNENRMLEPQIKVEDEYKTVSWDVALEFAAKGLKNSVMNNQGHTLATLADKTTSLEELYLLKTLTNKLGSENTENLLIKGENYSYLPSTVNTKQISDFDNIVILGKDLRYDEPIINAFVRLAKANITTITDDFISAVEGLDKIENSLIILTNEINTITNTNYLNNLIQDKFDNILNLSISGNVGSVTKLGFSSDDIYHKNSYILCNIAKENLNPNLLESINNANFVLSFDSFGGNEELADVILPIAGIYESAGTFIGVDNVAQSYNAAVMPPKNAKTAWKVIKVLADLLELSGFDFVSIDEITTLALSMEQEFNKVNEALDKNSGKNSNYTKQIDSFVRRTNVLKDRICG